MNDRELKFDAGHTATVSSATTVERALRFSNGSGDDVVDAVYAALGLQDSLEDEETTSEEFGDPLDILIRAEERGDL